MLGTAHVYTVLGVCKAQMDTITDMVRGGEEVKLWTNLDMAYWSETSVVFLVSVSIVPFNVWVIL